MSRRHHGRSRHARGRSDDGSRLQAPIEPRPETHREPAGEPSREAPVVDTAAQNRIMPGESLSGLNQAAPRVAPNAVVPQPATVPQPAMVPQLPHRRLPPSTGTGTRPNRTTPST